MRIGLCAGPEAASEAHAAGVDYLELNVQGHFVPLEDDNAWAANRDAIRSSAVPTTAANCFLPGSLPCTGPDVDAHAVLAYAETAFGRAAEVGAVQIVFGSGGARRIPEGFPPAEAEAQFVEILKGLGPLADRHGVIVVVEPLNTAECNFINSVTEGADLVRRAGHPSIRLLADVYHMGKDNEPPEHIGPSADLLRHAHVATIPDRAAPLPGDTSVAPYLLALKAAGYDGGISFECGFADRARDLAAAVRFVRETWDAA